MGFALFQDLNNITAPLRRKYRGRRTEVEAEDVKPSRRYRDVRVTIGPYVAQNHRHFTSVKLDGNDVASRTFFFGAGLRSVRLFGRNASHIEVCGICSLDGRLSTFATAAARSVARRPIVRRRLG